MVHFSN